MGRVTAPTLLWFVMALLIMVALLTARDLNGNFTSNNTAAGQVDMEPASISMGADGIIHLRE